MDLTEICPQNPHNKGLNYHIIDSKGVATPGTGEAEFGAISPL
jgi:hypothetical protein